MKSQKVGDRRVRYLRQGSGAPLVFLQGYGVRPHFYGDLLRSLSRDYDVVAPDLWRAGACGSQPSSLEECAELMAEFCRALRIDAPALIGHSMGGAVAFRAAANCMDARCVAGLNPALPVSYGRAGFAARSLVKSARETVGLAGGRRASVFSARFHGPFLFDTLRHPRATERFMSMARAVSYQGIVVPQPSLVLFAEADEYFDLGPDLEAELRAALPRGEIKRLPSLNHDWPLFYPERAELELRLFFDGG